MCTLLTSLVVCTYSANGNLRVYTRVRAARSGCMHEGLSASAGCCEVPEKCGAMLIEASFGKMSVRKNSQLGPRCQNGCLDVGQNATCWTHHVKHIRSKLILPVHMHTVIASFVHIQVTYVSLHHGLGLVVLSIKHTKQSLCSIYGILHGVILLLSDHASQSTFMDRCDMADLSAKQQYSKSIITEQAYS